MALTRCRHELMHAFSHTKPCPQNRHDDRFATRKNRGIHGSDWCLNPCACHWQRTRQLITHKQGYFLQQLSKCRSRRILAAQQRQFMLNQGVIEYVEIGKLCGIGHES